MPRPRPIDPITGKPLERSFLGKMLILFSRAVVLRCPACASRGVFENWLTLMPRCPGCGVPLQREGDGYFLGAMTLNIMVAEGIWAGAFAGLLYLTWPTPPWAALQWGSAVLMIALPLLFFPFTRTVWLAFDLLFRPVGRAEFQQPTAESPGWPGPRRRPLVPSETNPDVPSHVRR
ncbi:MAG: DUF983 domain-containing protein [Chloroflexi bacterium]|nr:DUF983 domain-containing protein [Chloroflexota bacterium]